MTPRDRRAGLLRRAAVVATAGCGAVAVLGLPSATAETTRSSPPGGRVVSVVAAENFWGSIASQIGGVHAHVVSIITNPNTDPHSYEPTAQDARTLADGRFVIENGIGYDPWVPKLLAADESSPAVLNVGDLLGIATGANPHRWYNPGDVQTVINQIVADYQKLDPANRAYFTQQRIRFDTVALGPYDTALDAIKARYAGTAVGASESIFSMLAPSLGLNVITPASFLKAISEGTDATAADRETIDQQIKQHRIRIYVYNRQNVTPDVQAQLQEVKAEHIPAATITETLSPASTTYQAWQTRQLRGIQAALATAATRGNR